MSNTHDHIASINPDSSIEKPSLVSRGVNFVKTHKKATIAVAAVSGLVVASALVNRNAAVSVDIPEFPEADSSKV